MCENLTNETPPFLCSCGTKIPAGETCAESKKNACSCGCCHEEEGENAAAAKAPWARLALAGMFALSAELLSHIHLSGAPGAVLVPLAALAAVLLGGLNVYASGLAALWRLKLNMNALMTVAASGAFCIGSWAEGAMVMVLFSVSEALEGLTLVRARRAVKALLAEAPETALVLQEDGSWLETRASLVPVGSRVRVRPGERIAFDGVVVCGESTVNQAQLTGESMPVAKAPGDRVFAGSLNNEGSFEFETSAAADKSTLARILQAVEEARGCSTPLTRFVDRFAAAYTPLVFLAALACALLLPLAGTSWQQSVYTALVFLVIGCPCALVVSTPVAIVSAMAAAGKSGILVKNGVFLEQGRLLECIAFDKTGTLTSGVPRQTDCLSLGGMSVEDIAATASCLAAHSDHPVSRALAGHAGPGAATARVSQFRAIPGQGIQGLINGKVWYLGNRRLASSLGLYAEGLEARLGLLEQEGKTVAILMDEHKARGLLAVADSLRETSVQAVHELKELGLELCLLSGDNEAAVRATAREAGIDRFRAGLLPEEKLLAVSELAEKGKTGMAGDGINDAPALARAHIGFALARGGADVAIESADVALMDGDLRKIARFIRLSRATYAVLVQNIVFALSVKALFFGLALAGLANMWMAVFADVGALLLVMSNSLRLLRK